MAPTVQLAQRAPAPENGARDTHRVPLPVEDLTLSTFRVEQLAVLHVGPIDLSLTDGECLVLRGPSGSGKSLLLRAMADLLPHTGHLLLDGKPSESFRGHQWRRQVAYLPAHSQWWFDTVGEHFPAAVDRRDLAALDLPADVLAWDVTRCSTGERQRLGILRLLANTPRVLLLDEPTASLDRDNIRRVEDLIDAYRQAHDAPVIWVSHDREQATRIADQVMQLQDGRLAAAA